MPREDQVQLELPASPEYGLVARTAAVQLALSQGFSVPEIDDVRLLIDEAVVMLFTSALGIKRIKLTYSIQENMIQISLTGLPTDGDPITADSIEHFTEAVSEIVDEYTIDAIHRQLSLSKVRESAN